MKMMLIPASSASRVFFLLALSAGSSIAGSAMVPIPWSVVRRVVLGTTYSASWQARLPGLLPSIVLLSSSVLLPFSVPSGPSASRLFSSLLHHFFGRLSEDFHMLRSSA